MQQIILKRLLALAVPFMVAVRMCAQCFVWEMPPKDYSDIQRLTTGLYKVVCDGKIGVVKPDGTQMVPDICSRITPFYEQRALLLAKERDKDRVIGCVTITGQCHLFSNTYYALAGQEFYSDGLLSVENGNGEKGYIDERGNEVVAFGNHYDVIKPFSEGFASVFRNKKYHLINKSGTPMPMVIGIGEVIGGTNVFNGNAYIWDSDGKFYTYNVQSGKCKHAGRPNSTQVDYLYCLSEISKRGNSVPYVQAASGKIGISPQLENGKSGTQVSHLRYGYSLDGKVLLPPQFERATAVEDGYAIVSLNRELGILRFKEDMLPTTVTYAEDTIEYESGATIECLFNVSVPNEYKEDRLDVTVNDGNMDIPVAVKTASRYAGVSPAVNLSYQSYSFMWKPQTGSQTFTVTVYSNGLVIATGTISYTFVQKHHESPVPAHHPKPKKKNDLPSIFIK